MDNKNVTILDEKEQFQLEQDKVLETILEARYFAPWKNREPLAPNDVPPGNLEIFITSSCNQHCEYCYLVKHPQLYPSEFNKHDLIMKNMTILFDWAIENNYHIPTLDIFTGEIWHSNWGLEVLDLIYDYIANKGLWVDGIMIPSNCSFIHDKKQTIEIQNRINKFKKIGIYFRFSISIDGKVIEDQTRPLKDGHVFIKDDKFYDDVFLFAKYNDFGFHPMVSSVSSDKWIENFEWWKKMLRKYDLPMDYLMMLEVRNDDWTDQTIEDYRKFVKYLVDDAITFHKGDIESVCNDLFSVHQTYNLEPAQQLWGPETSYTPFCFGDEKGLYGCTISSHLTVRLGDLAIAPCHRTAYNKQLYGHFKVENDKIVGIKANNPHLAIHILMTDRNYSTIGCDTCTFQNLCIGTCKGQSVEATGDPIHNDPKVCAFLKQKYANMFDIYEEVGIMPWLEENITEYHSGFGPIKAVIDVYHRYKKEKNDAELDLYRQNFYWKD